MKLFLLWLKQYTAALGFSVFVFFVFLVVCFLNQVPLGPVIYAAELVVCFGILAAAVGFLRFRPKYRELEKLKDHVLVTEKFPEAALPTETLYQEMIRFLKEDRLALQARDQQAYREMTEYYTMWAHQIKTPISAMRLLLQQEDTETNRELYLELFRIEQYVQMALQYLRLESSSQDIVLKKHDLDSLIRQAVKKYAPLFIRKKLSLNYEPVQCQVLTDEKWLVFVLEQVLSNAIKYTPKGSITISMDTRYEKTLVIEDTGIGIAAEDIPRIFEQGYTGLNGRYDRNSTGIGLYLSKRAMERLSHRIEITSVPGKGTKVFLHLDTVELERQ